MKVFVRMCVCAGGGARGGPGAFTRSASCRVEWLEGDNNSQVKIQLFAWGLTLWGLSGRSAGGGVGGFSFWNRSHLQRARVSVQTPGCKYLEAATEGQRWQFYTNFVGRCEVTQLLHPVGVDGLKRCLWCSLDVLIQSCSDTSARSCLHWRFITSGYQYLYM